MAMPRSPLPYWSVPMPAAVALLLPPGVVSCFFDPQAARKTANDAAAPAPPTAFRKRLREEGSAASSSTALVCSEGFIEGGKLQTRPAGRRAGAPGARIDCCPSGRGAAW